jgi:UDP-N-acetyl-2-amino-2-deoxyglucuronate dehydrogenase
MSSPLRIAIVGSGNIASTHAMALSLVPDVRLVAVCARNEKSGALLAEKAGARVFASVDELLSGGNFDAALIATPSGVHQDAVLPLLKAGRHVLCEKPLEIATSRVRAMLTAAEEAGVILAGFFPLRCGAGAQAIRDAVEVNRFGRMTFVSARVKWWRDGAYYGSSGWRGTWDLDGGGALMNQGIHAVDLLQWCGGPVREVSAFSGTLAHDGLEVEDTLAATLHFESGALGTLAATTSCYPGLPLSLEVSGDRGTAVLVDDKIERWSFAEEAPGDEIVRANGEAGQVRGGASDPRAISCEGHRRQIEGFCRSIREGVRDFIPATEAGRAVAIVEAIYEAARSGKTQPVQWP